MLRHFGFLGLIAVPFTAIAQPATTADRAALPAPASSDGFVVKTLRLFGPYERNPLTERERFRLYIGSMIGPSVILGEATSAAVSQGLDSPHEWGQGAAGYGKRFGSDMAYNAVHSTITYGISSALKEDTRYFASGRPTIGGRVWYALASPLMAHKANGRAVFSFSQASGIVGAAAISNLWYPPSRRGPGNTAGNAGLTYAGMAAANLFREFVPDLIRRLR